MAEFAISYSHRDNGLAARVHEIFRDRGRSVWIDEAGDYHALAEGVNLPWGQEHWKVITDEFAAAQTVVVIDTPHWRASPYCADEYRFLRDWGKRVFVLDLADVDAADSAAALPRQIDEVISTTDAHRELLGAHTRLVEVARRGDSAPRSRLDALLNRGAARDARTVLDGDLTGAGLWVPQALADRARSAIATAERSRRRIRRAAISTVAVLSVLALVGVIAMFVAQAGRRSATTAAARSQALDLSSRAYTEPDTLRAIRDAQQAVATQDTAVTRGSLNAARARDARTRVLTLDDLDFREAAWSGDGNFVVAIGGSNNRVQSVDVRTGTLGPAVRVDEPITRNTTVVSERGDRLAYRGADSGVLRVVDVRSGRTVDSSAGGTVTAVTSVGGEVWFATADGGLWSSPFESAATPSKRGQLDAAVAGFVIGDGGSSIDFVDSSGSLRSGTLADGRFDQRTTVPVIAPADIAGVTAGGTAGVRRCGNSLFAIVSARAAIKSKFFAQVGGVPTTNRWLGGATPMICGPGNTTVLRSMSGLGVGGPGAPVVPTGARLNLLVSSPVADRAAVLTDAGRLYIRKAVVERPQRSGIVDVYEIGGTGFEIRDTGDVTRAGDSEVLSNVGKYFALRIAGPVAGRVAIADPSGVTAIDGAGRATRLAAGEFTAVREGADGTHFVALSSRTTPILLDAATGDRRAVPVVGLTDGESVTDADIAPDGRTLVAVTSAGRVGTVPVGGTGDGARFTQLDLRIPASSRNAVAFTAPDRFVLAPADGALRMFDTGGRLLATTVFGGVADSLRATGNRVLVSSDQIGTMLLDAHTLEVQDLLAVTDYPITARTVSSGRVGVIGVASVAQSNSVSGDPGDAPDQPQGTRAVYAIPLPTR